LRKRLKAQLISERLEGGEPGEIFRHDPELRELERLSSMLEAVSMSEPMPSRQAQARMRDRVMESHRRLMEGEHKREKDPAKSVSTLEPRRLSYPALAAAAVLAAILVVSAVVFTGPAEITIQPTLPSARAEAAVFATGPVEVLPPGGEWTEMEGDITLEEGGAVRTPGGVRAEVAYGGENLFRLDYGSEASLPVISEDAIVVELRSGEGYFRAQEGTTYTVRGGGLEARAVGTAFDVDLTAETPELLALQRGVEAVCIREDAGSVMLDEGGMLSLPQDLGTDGLSGQVREISMERLQEEWLLWNRDIDSSRGWDVGILSSVEPPPSQVPEISSLGEEEGGGEEDEEGEEEGGETLEMFLLAGLQQGGVALSWDLSGGEVAEFILLRAEGGEPAYPRDVLARLPSDARQFLDREVADGRIYTYRVAAESGGGLTYSNAVTVAVPEKPPVIQLDARLIDGGAGMPVVQLSWHVEGRVTADTYVLVRGEMNVQPVYPPGNDMVEFRFAAAGPDYSFIDRDVYTGYTYNYRVFAVSGGAVTLESNPVSVYVDTAAILEQ